MALVQAGKLDNQTASLLKLAYSGAATGQRLAEDALRAMERRIGVKTLALLRDQAQRVAAAPDVLLDAEQEAAALYDALITDLNATAQIGAKSAIITAARGGAALGFDWALVNEGAATWAEQYAATLTKEITETTLKQLQGAVSAFHSTPGMTRAELERLILEGPAGIEDLVSKTGRIIPAAQRAELIATTEVTRSYSAGEVEGLRASGLEMVEPTEQPPAHVNCRCDISPFPREDGVMSWRWLTLNDDLVCEICEPLHGQDVGAT